MSIGHVLKGTYSITCSGSTRSRVHTKQHPPNHVHRRTRTFRSPANEKYALGRASLRSPEIDKQRRLSHFHTLSSSVEHLKVPRLKPWPNGPPNTSQLEPSSQLRWSWVSFGHPLGLSWLELDRVGLNLIKVKFSPNSSQVFHRLATSANSHQVVLLLLCAYAVVFRQLNGFLNGLTWRYRLSTCQCKF